MKDLVESEEQTIKGVMVGVPDPYTGLARNVIIRETDHAFWNHLLDGLAIEKETTTLIRKRVAVVGTPGIGKSTTAAYAIRQLLIQKKIVVYLQCSVHLDGYYIQFSPSKEIDGEIDIQLIPETKRPANIPSLNEPDTYYVVDPGKTKTSCDPSHLVAARVIIVASPDDRHWGGNAFEKNDQSHFGGYILYFPSWDLPQLKAASNELPNGTFQRGEVEELFSIFGGVPRQVFFPILKASREKELKRKVEGLQEAKLADMVTGQQNRHSGFGADQPGGGLVDFVVSSEDYTEVELKLASSSILRWVRMRFMQYIWEKMAIYPSAMSWQLLEDYLLYALQNANHYTTRNCVGISDPVYKQLHVESLGQCTSKTLVADCTVSVLSGEDQSLFYSSDRQHPLYDMIYKVGNIYFAFQVTLGRTHPAKQHQIDILVARLGIGTGGKELRLYYAVHEAVFDKFATDNVKPTAATGVSIFHLKLAEGLVA